MSKKEKKINPTTRIKQLEGVVAEQGQLVMKYEKSLNEWRDNDTNRRKRLSLILSSYRKDGYPHNSAFVETLDWQTILELISKLKGQVIGEGATIPLAITQAREENAKLWYLIRSVFQDNPEEPINPQTNQSRFEKPNFNN